MVHQLSYLVSGPYIGLSAVHLPTPKTIDTSLLVAPEGMRCKTR